MSASRASAGPALAGARLAGAVLAGAVLAGCTGARSSSAPGAAPVAAGRATAPAPGVRSAPAACPAPASPSAGLPDLTLPCLSAGGPASVPLRRLGGRPLVLTLWASWCEPCRTELPAFARLSAATGPRLTVLGVQTKDAAANAAETLRATGVRFPSLYDLDGLLLARLKVFPALPVTVLVAPDGRVAEVYQGPALDDTTLRRQVRDRLGVAA